MSVSLNCFYTDVKVKETVHLLDGNGRGVFQS